MSNRIVATLVVVTMLLALAAACGPQPTPQTIIQTVEKEVIVEKEVVVTVQVPAVKPFEGTTLNFVGWQGYEDPDAFQPFYDATGMTLSATYPGSLEEVISLYQAGGPGSYDIGVGMNRYIKMMFELGMLEPLDESKLPNLAQMLPAFKTPDYWGRIDGKLYAVPAFVGFDALCYNADKGPEVDWNFWKLPEYKNKYGVLKNPLGSLYLWAMMLDKSLDAREWTQDDLTQIKALGKEIYKDALTLVPGEGEASDLLARGDITAMWGCNTGVAARAKDAGANIKAVVPKGRTKMWADFYFIYKGSKNIDAAHAWINQAISAQAMALMMSKMGYNAPNEKSYTMIDPDLAKKLNYPGVNEYIVNAPLSVLPDKNAKPPKVSVDDMYKAYDEVLATIN